MDYKEAIGIFENEIKKLNTRPIHVNHIGDAEKADDAMKTAISAMQELQMYKDAKLCLIPEDVFSRQCEELDAYKELGTLEEVREAVERQKEKKVTDMRGNDKLKFCTCPSCGRRITNVEGGNYCQNCGQKLDWSEEE